MRTIHKYNLEARDRQVVQLPTGAQILHVGAQDTTGHTLQLWALVDTNATTVDHRTFVIAGTGNPLQVDAAADNYLATVITAGGALVWHVFEVGP